MNTRAVIELNRCLAAAPAEDRPRIEFLMRLADDAREIRIWPDRISIIERNGTTRDAYFADGRVVVIPPPKKAVQMEMFS